MNFCQFMSLYDAWKHNGGIGLGPSDYYNVVVNHAAKHFTNSDSELDSAAWSTGFYSIVAEQKWFRAGRPYYKVFPSVARALFSVSLDIVPEEYSLPETVLLIRFAETSLPQVPDTDYSMATILANCMRIGSGPEGFLCASVHVQGRFAGQRGSQAIVFPPARFVLRRTLEFFVASLDPRMATAIGSTDVSVSDAVVPKLIYKQAIRAAMTILLLQNDPSIIQPDVLADDRRRFDESHDPALRQRLIEKAKRRGVVGWRIGESYETIPHFRRPHFAIRYTGRGRAVPRIVAVKGAIVHRQKITSVPTGYITPEGMEVEHDSHLRGTAGAG